MIDLDPILSGFDPISLKQMDNVKLQNRVDTKFMFREALLPAILGEMQKNYFALELGTRRYNHYETLYFDTDQFKLYIGHHNGKLNRYKFRSRRYVESDLNFFEIKFKNNKGRTIKDRIKGPELVKAIEGKPEEFVRSISNVDPQSLQPKLWVNYMRMTFVNKTSQERLTIDTRLTFKNDKVEVLYDGLVIAEVKRGSATEKSPFIGLMRKYSVQARSISKSCLGVISLNPQIKKNRFKPTLLYLNKLLNAS
ncbi:MAG: polyphosphate polymerase domain-containing protein [Bacteroidia bacterium]|nr:polyphosphate polymerase domain-containing protein [Bacteroidia bacterium]